MYKYNAKKRFQLGTSLVILFVITGFILSKGMFAQTETSEDNKILNVVESYWEYAETGKFAEASALTTDRYREIGVEAENQEPPEKWINNFNLKHITISIHKKSQGDKCVVAVKVKGKDRVFYLFHDLVKNDEGDWKIISTSY